MTAIGYRNLKDSRRIIALDTETTGISFAAGDRIVEIGCVELINGQQTGNDYQQYIDPERSMPEEALRIHGLTEEFLKGKPKFVDIADGFLEYVGDSPLVIHNADFDVRFLNAELSAAGRPTLKNEVCDTMVYALRHFPGIRASLDNLLNRFKIDRSARTLHGALLDATLLAQLYARMMGIDGLGISGPAVIGAVAAQSNQSRLTSSGPVHRKRRPYREPVIPSSYEIGVHDALLDEIKGAVWEAFQDPDQHVAIAAAA